MPAVLLDTMPRMQMTLGHHMSHLGSLTTLTTHANSKWSSSLPETPVSGSALKKHRSGSALGEAITPPPKVILSQEAAAAAKDALRRQQQPVQRNHPAAPTGPLKAEQEEKTTNKTAAEVSDPAWGIFKSREDFLEMHIC
ncbi:hypothetical protein BV898_01946 [Hypsibius exemplaris]|uniref:Uncharacterized protein n=1 Tax=Hypsibius exemplaris TaxID=2072580 RepID=A0A1W0XAJ0_HYPEX|nr:hypothetical protein BV898_01946 [Hypsibius exemplaris]